MPWTTLNGDRLLESFESADCAGGAVLLPVFRQTRRPGSGDNRDMNPKILCRCLAFVATTTLLPGGSLLAEEWAIVGARALGMGGAGVAVTRGAHSTYWNPANLAPPRGSSSRWDLALPVTFAAAATGDVLQDIDRIRDSIDDLDIESISNKFENGNPLTDAEAQALFRLLTEELPALSAEGKGLLTQASAGLSVRAGNFGFSALGVFHGGGVNGVDITNLPIGNRGLDDFLLINVNPATDLTPDEQQLAQNFFDAGLVESLPLAQQVVFQAKQGGVNLNDPAAVDALREVLRATRENDGGDLLDSFENQTAVNLRGIAMQEYALAYAQPFFEFISVGVSVKAIHGTTFFQPFSVAEIEDPVGLAEDLADAENQVDTLNFGVDVGVLVQPASWLSIGVVGRNLNRPEFDFDGPGDYIIEPQVRAGVGLYPFDGLAVAVDVDVIENHSEALPGYDSQVIAAGLEYAALNFLFLRGGVSKNLAETREDLQIHAGLGVSAGFFSLDVAASVIPDLVNIEEGGDELPERAAASVFIGINVPLP